jgi:hypothetical protein
MTDARPIVTPPVEPTGVLEPIAERHGRRREGERRRPRDETPAPAPADDEVVIAPTGDRVDVRA